jgi:hypothetical protein
MMGMRRAANELVISCCKLDHLLPGAWVDVTLMLSMRRQRARQSFNWQIAAAHHMQANMVAAGSVVLRAIRQRILTLMMSLDLRMCLMIMSHAQDPPVPTAALAAAH